MHLYVVEDGPEKTFQLGNESKINHYCWQDFDELEHPEIIPRGTDCVRSFGFLKAYQAGADIIISLDDDVTPDPSKGGNTLREHVIAMDTPANSGAWQNTLDGLVVRGLPYEQTRRNWQTWLNHGLWQGTPDLDAVTALFGHRLAFDWKLRKPDAVSVGAYFPMCGMNVSFRRELTPAMYFLLMGPDYPFDRFGDIWAGVIAKKICDYLGKGVRTGWPVVQHQRASNTWANLRKEASGYSVNELFWQAVDDCRLAGVSVEACYWDIADKMVLPEAMNVDDYGDKLRAAMKRWAEYFMQWEPPRMKGK